MGHPMRAQQSSEANLGINYAQQSQQAGCDEPQRRSQTCSALEILGSELQQLEKAELGLRDRLGSVLRPEEPRDKSEELPIRGDMEPQCEVAAKIQNMIDLARIIRARIDRTHSLLEN